MLAMGGGKMTTQLMLYQLNIFSTWTKIENCQLALRLHFLLSLDYYENFLNFISVRNSQMNRNGHNIPNSYFIFIFYTCLNTIESSTYRYSSIVTLAIEFILLMSDEGKLILQHRID